MLYVKYEIYNLLNMLLLIHLNMNDEQIQKFIILENLVV